MIQPRFTALPMFIERHRDEIVYRALCRSTLPEERTVLLDAVLHRAIEKLAEAEANNDRAVFTAWVSQQFGSLTYAPAVRAAVAATLIIISELANERGVVAGNALSSLTKAVHDIAEGAAKMSAAALQAPTDEVDATLNSLMLQLDGRDPLTAEHSRAVQSWCARIARRMSASQEETEHLARCGLIHDIGKVRTPTEILNAPRALSLREWAIMRSHSAVGAAMLDPFPLLFPLRGAVRSHHERIDGTGYPDGLQGTEIPFSARVVAVADCFNAMIGRRPYRPPMAPSEALEELRRHRNTQLDPEIVDMMIEAVTREG